MLDFLSTNLLIDATIGGYSTRGLGGHFQKSIPNIRLENAKTNNNFYEKNYRTQNDYLSDSLIVRSRSMINDYDFQRFH